ncbi:hypothetical protein F4777DRAFT_515543 [Nemania sp. FL0916]|nr:hypothetical protein F4777DRAFT_515543 [Nemania sp. FL0916]
MFALWLKTYDPDQFHLSLRAHDPSQSRIIPEKTNENIEMETQNQIPTCPPPIYYALRLKLLNIAHKLIAQTNDTQMLDGRGSKGTALQLAAHRGYLKIVDALLVSDVPINSPAGLRGTALYAASARGHTTVVRRLLERGASLNGTKDGPLGNPLHIAAFRGHNEVMELLLRQGGAQVDHLAGPFGTALQAASASKNRGAVELLLGFGADPNIVGGCLGTAVQAALGEEIEDGKDGRDAFNRLLSGNAKYRCDSNFWSVAYERAASEHPLPRYSSLIIHDMEFPKGLEEPERLLVGTIRTWTLPCITSLEKHNEALAERIGCKLPLYFQVQSILRAAPRLEINIEELSRKDFRHKALFWAGMNHIFRSLSPLIESFSQSILKGVDSPHESTVTWMNRSLRLRNFRKIRDGSADIDLEWHPLMSDFGSAFISRTRNMNRSDLLAIHTMKYTQDSSLNIGEIMGQDIPSNQKPRIWLAGNLLPLLKDLLRYAARCASYHEDAMERRASLPEQTIAIVQDLTFELFSAIIRLSLHIDSDEALRRGNANLFLTVKLLCTIRLPRISELDAMCEVLLAEAPKTNNNQEEHERIVGQMMEQVKQTVTDQMGGLKNGIEAQFTQWQPYLIEQVRAEISDVVKNEVSQAIREALDSER